LTVALKDFVPHIISVIALGVSIYALYKSNLQAARLRVYVGDRIYLVGPVGHEAFVNVPLEVVNSGARTGVLHCLEMVVTEPAGTELRFEWSQFYRYSAGKAGSAVEKESDPHPISLAGRTARPLSIQFALTSKPPEGFTWGAGNYTGDIRGWHDLPSRRERPNIEEHFSFSMPASFDEEIFGITKPGNPPFMVPVRVTEWTSSRSKDGRRLSMAKAWYEHPLFTALLAFILVGASTLRTR